MPSFVSSALCVASQMASAEQKCQPDARQHVSCGCHQRDIRRQRFTSANTNDETFEMKYDASKIRCAQCMLLCSLYCKQPISSVQYVPFLYCNLVNMQSLRTGNIRAKKRVLHPQLH